MSSNSLIPVIPSAGSTNSFPVRVMKNPTVAGPFWLTRGPGDGRGFDQENMVNLPRGKQTGAILQHLNLSWYIGYSLQNTTCLQDFAGYPKSAIWKTRHLTWQKPWKTILCVHPFLGYPVWLDRLDPFFLLTFFVDKLITLSESRPKKNAIRPTAGVQQTLVPCGWCPFSWFLVHFGRFEKPHWLMMIVADFPIGICWNMLQTWDQRVPVCGIF